MPPAEIVKHTEGNIHLAILHIPITVHAPQKLESSWANVSNLAKTGLLQLMPSRAEDLLAAIDQPLKIAKDTTNGTEYLLCDYNRDGDSYR